MARKGIRIGFLGAVGLVLLRLAIGWQFLYAGIDKLTNPDFTSDGFLGQSKGPLAEDFHRLIPDYDGRERLTLETHTVAFQKYADDFSRRALSPDQLARVRAALDEGQSRLKEFFKDNKEAIEDYWHEQVRLAAAKEQPTRDVPYEQKRNWEKQQKQRGTLTQWSDEIDGIWKQFKSDLDQILTKEQREATPPQKDDDKRLVDRIVTYTNIAIGVCLLGGLFTRLASLGGALFLLQIVLAQPDWPGLYPPPHPSAGRALFVNKEAIEMLAMFALAVLPTGRWAGLDFFIHHLIVRPIFGKKETA